MNDKKLSPYLGSRHLFSVVVAFAMSRAKIGVFPQLAISLIKGQVAASDAVGEDRDRYLMVDMSLLTVIGKRFGAERADIILRCDQPGPFMR